LCLFVFQAVCFTIWQIPRSKRADYVVVDRHHLAYLNFWEKLNCIYCGYANGVFAWACDIAARTEHFWCPIKHAKRVKHPHSFYHDYVEFGDWDRWKGHASRKTPKK